MFANKLRRKTDLFKKHKLSIQIIETNIDFKMMIIQLICFGRRQIPHPRYLAIDFEWIPGSYSSGIDD